MINKIGIFSITLDRLYYTCHCFKELKKQAGTSFEHIVIDNGSKDGTWELLKEEGYNTIRNEENKGITIASIQGYRWLLDKKIDISPGSAIVFSLNGNCTNVT